MSASGLFWMSVGRLLARERPAVRRRLTWKGRLLRLGLLLLLGATAYAVYAIPRTPALQVQMVEVEGVQALSAEDVIAETGLLGHSIFLVRSGPIERRLEQHPYVARATVEHGLNSTVHVRIVERTPRLVWKSGGEMYVIDDSGVVLEKVTRRPRLPMLETAEEVTLVPGARIDTARVSFVLGLFSGLPVDVRPVTEKLVYRPESGYELVSTAGWSAIVGDESQVGVKAAVLRQVLTKPGVQFVDVSAPGNPYYRLHKPRSSQDAGAEPGE